MQWRFANEQFAYLAQRTVEETLVALARDALRLTGLTKVALAGGVASNVKATRRVRLLAGVVCWLSGDRRRRNRASGRSDRAADDS